ncbi:MAG: hypothetical protein JNK04_00940 [Myxococcales bacterium]|nr:hypothetical protein [Myxococcales bacterium]
MHAKNETPIRPRNARSKKPLRAAFVVTAALATGAGCGSTVSPCEVESCNPPIPECPVAMPSTGDSCDPELGTCGYVDDCGSDVTASCEDGEWVVDIGSCNPPPPGDCPAQVPAAGDPCDPEVGSCQYADDCGQTITASCNGATWEVDPVSSCNPPPPCPITLPAEGDPCELTPGGTPRGCTYDVETACGPATATAECVEVEEQGLVWLVTAPPCTPPEPSCFDYTNAGVCEADSTCRWLVPGCGGKGDPGFAAGCFPALECTVGPSDNCGELEECVTLNHDPCWNSSCGACGSDTNVCLPVFTNE